MVDECQNSFIHPNKREANLFSVLKFVMWGFQHSFTPLFMKGPNKFFPKDNSLRELEKQCAMSAHRFNQQNTRFVSSAKLADSPTPNFQTNKQTSSSPQFYLLYFLRPDPISWSPGSVMECATASVVVPLKGPESGASGARHGVRGTSLVICVPGEKSRVLIINSYYGARGFVRTGCFFLHFQV